MKKRIPVKVFAPASVANVAVGFDILGFAIEGIGDEVKLKPGNSPGLKVRAIHHNKNLSKDINKNTAAYAAFKVMESLNLEDEAIEMDLYKKMDIGTGMGSSAASAVAGAFAMNEYLGRPYSKHELLKFATMGEVLADGAYHADNVAPSLLGSIILIRDNATLDFVKLPVPPGLRCVLIHPKIEILTKDSRDVLKPQIDLKSHIVQSGNLAAFIASLYKMDLELMKRSLKDVIIEPQRAQLIPHFHLLQSAALESGAIGSSISGAGPSVFALCSNTIIADKVKESWSDLYKEKGIDYDIFISKINTQGAIKC